MNTCEFQSSCSFYNDLMKRRSPLLKYVVDEHCNSNYTECARFMVSKTLGPSHVPSNLFPEDMLEARKILDDLN